MMEFQDFKKRRYCFTEKKINLYGIHFANKNVLNILCLRFKGWKYLSNKAFLLRT